MRCAIFFESGLHDEPQKFFFALRIGYLKLDIHNVRRGHLENLLIE